MTANQNNNHFYKMHGCGNDFVIIDNRDYQMPKASMQEFAIRVCKRGFGIGADGLIILDVTPADRDEDYIWHFYNADGMEGEMCGNGARCAAWLAHRIGLAPRKHTLGTIAGTVRCEVYAEQEEVKVELTKPFDLSLNLAVKIDAQSYTTHFVNTGVPHAVVFVDDVKQVNVAQLGRLFRYHEQFLPHGTNVNFVQTVDPNHLLVRTYERGVEVETYACGTGCCASVMVANQLNLTKDHAQTKTHGGFDLTIELNNGIPFLQGPVELVYEGTMN